MKKKKYRASLIAMDPVLTSMRMFRDVDVDNFKSRGLSDRVPQLHFTPTSPPLAEQGSIAWDVDNKLMMYCDGQQWISFNDAAGLANINGFNLRLAADQNIPSGVPTVLAPLAAPALPYNTIAQWNLATGGYIETQARSLDIHARVAWRGDALNSNLGSRTLQILVNGVVAAQNVVQPAANDLLDTVQMISVTLDLVAGDVVVVRVIQDSGVTLAIRNDTFSSISGVRLFPPH